MSLAIAQAGVREAWWFQFKEAGVVIDITGMNAYLYVKYNKSDTDAQAVFSAEFLNGTHDDAANGLTTTIYQSAASTLSLEGNVCWYEVRLFSGGVPIKNTVGQIEYKTTVMDKITE